MEMEEYQEHAEMMFYPGSSFAKLFPAAKLSGRESTMSLAEA